MFWSCQRLQTFWEKIFGSLSDIYSIKMSPQPIIALFGVMPRDTIWPAGLHDVVAFTTLLARRLILLNWKRPVPPSHTRWLKEIMFYLKLEKIKFTLRGAANKFEKVCLFSRILTLPKLQIGWIRNVWSSAMSVYPLSERVVSI